MNWLQPGTAARLKLLALLVPLMVLAAVACTPAQTEMLQGVLQRVDAISGDITITTKDGKTMTMKIATEAPVETEGATSALEALEPGTSLEVEVNSAKKLVRRIKAHQAKVKGVIVDIARAVVPEGTVPTTEPTAKLTIKTEQGRRLTLVITKRTTIDLGGDVPGTPANLSVGAGVEAKFDPSSRVAFKIYAKQEKAEIKGVIARVGDGKVTIKTVRGRRLTLLVGDRTQIELGDDSPGTYADLPVGGRVEAKFDPSTRNAFTIEAAEAVEPDASGGQVEGKQEDASEHEENATATDDLDERPEAQPAGEGTEQPREVVSNTQEVEQENECEHEENATATDDLDEQPQAQPANEGTEQPGETMSDTQEVEQENECEHEENATATDDLDEQPQAQPANEGTEQPGEAMSDTQEVEQQGSGEEAKPQG